jgi:hypothetical protein
MLLWRLRRSKSRDECAAAKRHEAHASDKPSQVGEVAGLAVGRRQPDRCQVQAEVRDGAEDQHPCPDENVNAVFVSAHPACQNDLREVEKSGAEHPNRKGRKSIALGTFTFSVRGEEINGLCQDISEDVRSSGE